jgi:abhydrolase domain-containing protein 12
LIAHAGKPTFSHIYHVFLDPGPSPENDWDIPHTHSDVLFDAFLEPYLPPVTHTLNASTSSLSREQWLTFMAEAAARKDKKAEIVSNSTITHFGEIQEFEEGGKEGMKRSVTLLKMLQGKHDYVGTQEGLQFVIGKKFNLL